MKFLIYRNFWDLILFKTGANLKAEVSRDYLNFLWWLIDPILTMMVFYLVFGIFLQRGGDHFIAVLLCGITFWNWFARSVTNSLQSIMQGKDLMHQVAISKIFFPLEVIFLDSFKQLFVVPLLLTFLFFYETPVSLTWIVLPVLMFIQFILIAGSAILAAAIIPFIPDLRFVVISVLQLVFFASGVFWDIDKIILPKHQFYIYANPIAGLLKNYRDILLYNTWPDWIYLLKVFLFASILLVFACWMVRRLENIYPRICY